MKKADRKTPMAQPKFAPEANDRPPVHCKVLFNRTQAEPLQVILPPGRHTLGNQVGCRVRLALPTTHPAQLVMHVRPKGIILSQEASSAFSAKAAGMAWVGKLGVRWAEIETANVQWGDYDIQFAREEPRAANVTPEALTYPASVAAGPITAAGQAQPTRVNWRTASLTTLCAGVVTALVLGGLQNAESNEMPIASAAAMVPTPSLDAWVDNAGLGKSVTVSRAEQGQPLLRGLLTSTAECEAMANLRAGAGGDAFTDQVLCLPEVAERVQSYLASSTVRAEVTEGRIVLLGIENSPEVQGRLRSLKEMFAGQVDIDTNAVTTTPTADPAVPMTAPLRNKVASVVVTPDASYLITHSGEQVYVGGLLTPKARVIDVRAHQFQVLVDGTELTVPL
jgi:hypothetical protein